jgi:hypothetical protein
LKEGDYGLELVVDLFLRRHLLAILHDFFRAFESYPDFEVTLPCKTFLTELCQKDTRFLDLVVGGRRNQSF